jgi:hypothetical protein
MSLMDINWENSQLGADAVDTTICSNPFCHAAVVEKVREIQQGCFPVSVRLAGEVKQGGSA